MAEIDPIPGKPIGDKTLVPENWNSGLVGPFGNKTGQPLLPWRFKVDFEVTQQAKESFNDHNLKGRCPIDILETFIEEKNGAKRSQSLRKGYGRWQSLEVVQTVSGEEQKWDIGTLYRSIINYKKAPLILNLYAIETTSLFVKKLAILLMDCAIERTTGYYFPFPCRFPLNIRLTIYGFKDGYTRVINYYQCGIVKDKEYDMRYDADKVMETYLTFLCTKPEFANITNYYDDQWLKD